MVSSDGGIKKEKNMTNKIYNRFFIVEPIGKAKSSYKLVKRYTFLGVTFRTAEYFRPDTKKPFRSLMEAAYEFERLEELSSKRLKGVFLNIFMVLLFLSLLVLGLSYSPLKDYWLLQK